MNTFINKRRVRLPSSLKLMKKWYNMIFKDKFLFEGWIERGLLVVYQTERADVQHVQQVPFSQGRGAAEVLSIH